MVIRLSDLRFFLTFLLFGGGSLFLTGCNANVAGRQRPFLKHGPIKGELELVAESRTDERGSGQNKTKGKTKVFEERLKLWTTGDVYHPNFLFYNVALGFGLTQQNFSSDNESDSDCASLKEYNVLAQFLRTKPYPLTVYMNRSDDLIARQFLGALESERESFGASLPLQSEDWPMMFQYNTSSVSQKALASTANDFFTRDDERFRYSLDHDFSKLSHMSFEFNRDSVSQKNLNVSTDVRTDRYTLLHDLIFGGKEQHRLDSFFSFLDQSGEFDLENTQWEERLKLQHSSNFLTNYGFRFTESKQQTFENSEVRGQAGFEHRLYKSLVTTANIFASESDFDDQGNLTQEGGSLNFNYQKKNPWGKLLSTYTASFTETDQAGGSGTGIIIDESHVFNDPVPITLNKVNVDTSTIVVTDSTGSNIYTLGDDYTVTEINGRTRLHVTTLGVIPPDVNDGQTILVDYNFFTEPKRQEETLRQNFTVRQRFDNGLSLYYWYQRQDEEVSSSITDITLDEFRNNTFGADYVKKGLALLAEYSKEDSTQISSTSKRLEARYSWRLNSDTKASIHASKHWLDFGDPDPRDIELFRVGGEIFSRLTDEYSISARLDFRDEEDSSVGTTEGIQFASELRYNFRRLSVTTGVEYDFLERRKNELSTIFLFFRLRRTF